MRVFFTMTKTNLKLLFRNVGFLVCLVLLPIGASLLHMVQTNEFYSSAHSQISEINSPGDVTILDTSMANVIVVDAAQDENSELLLKSLARENWCSIFRCRSEKLDQSEIETVAKHCYEGNLLTAVVYIPENFGDKIMNGEDSGIIVLEGREDSRFSLLTDKMNFNISVITNCALSASNSDQALSMAESVFEGMPRVERVTVDSGSGNLTDNQQNHLRNIGYAVAVLSLAFILTGCFVANLIVTENDNKSLLRIELSGVSMLKYIGSKALTAVVVTLIQTGVLAAAIVFLVGTDVGIPFWAYLLFMGTVGLIYNLFCLTIGILTKNIMFTIYIGFGVWVFSNLLSSVYFNFATLPDWWNRASLITPQKWVMISSETLMRNEGGAYAMFFIAAAAFLVIIITAGFIGTKVSDNSGKE